MGNVSAKNVSSMSTAERRYRRMRDHNKIASKRCWLKRKSNMQNTQNNSGRFKMGIKMSKHKRKNRNAEDQDWYHPGFEHLSQAIEAMKNMANIKGNYLVTNAPNTERETYYIVRRGEECSDIGYCIVRYIHKSAYSFEEKDSGFRISGIDNVFPSLFHLIQHAKLNPIPITTVPDKNRTDKTLKDPLPSCRQCRKCKSIEGRNTDQLNSEILGI